MKIWPLQGLNGSVNLGLTWTSFVVRLVGQLGYFLLIARALGPHDYGVVASVFALLTVFGSFGGLSSDHVMVSRVAVAPERFADYFGNCLIQTAATALPLALMVYGVSLFTAGMAVAAFAAFAAAELLFARFYMVAVSAFMAVESGRDLFVLNTGFSLIRLATCVAAILASRNLNIEIWAFWYLGGMTVSGLASLAYVVWRLGPPRWRLARGDLGLGFHFSLYFAADTTARELDKPLVALFAGPAVAGVYTAAFRVVDAAAMPLRALMATLYARFFKHGHRGIEHSFRFAVKVLPLFLSYALFASFALIAGSGYLPLLLGPKFGAVIPLVSRLAFLPVFWAIAAVGGDVLTSVGRQRNRAFIIAVLSLSQIPMLWFLVPRFGAEGAAYASLGDAALLALAMVVAVFLSGRDAVSTAAAAMAP
jgi:O-antigen/teichoic acid export membrane protein